MADLAADMIIHRGMKVLAIAEIDKQGVPIVTDVLLPGFPVLSPPEMRIFEEMVKAWLRRDLSWTDAREKLWARN